MAVTLIKQCLKLLFCNYISELKKGISPDGQTLCFIPYFLPLVKDICGQSILFILTWEAFCQTEEIAWVAKTASSPGGAIFVLQMLNFLSPST